MKIDGSCHCGRIAYEAEIDPEQVYICYCTDCQAISGGTYRWSVWVAPDDFRLTSGETRAYIKTTANSGRSNEQHFCADCASPIYSCPPDRSTYRLRLGTCRQRGELVPKTEYYRDSAQPWSRI